MIATIYTYMKNAGAPPRFEEAFAFKHILNAVDGALFLSEARPMNRHGRREQGCTNTDHAYAQAMNRFNTSALTATVDTILEPTVANPRPQRKKDPRSGAATYWLQVQRGWKFERVPNNNAGPNYTKFEAKLVAVFSSLREAKMSCMGNGGVVNHWDQAQNQTWFG
ncbi:MAG: hypothetical protein ACI87W_000653 [Halieaceae bacterium]|jgi:hypothetical protein